MCNKLGKSNIWHVTVELNVYVIQNNINLPTYSLQAAPLHTDDADALNMNPVINFCLYRINLYIYLKLQILQKNCKIFLVNWFF